MTSTQTATLSQRNLLAAKPAAPSTSTPPPKRVRPYRDFLTPALHRRFSHAAALVFAVCYLESILMSSPRLLWIWNPVSMTGIRALLLSLSCLAVFIVRVANLHCGELLSSSGISTLQTQLLQWRGLHTLCWYLYSALFFGEVYIWSKGRAAHLGWVDAGREEEWALLNENPIFLRALFVCLAVAQTIIHLTNDYDRIPISTKDDTTAPSATAAQPSAPKLPRSVDDLIARLPLILARTARLVVPGLAFTIPLYFICFRRLLWPNFYMVGRAIFPKLASQSRPTGFSHLPRLVWQCVSSSAMLVLLWEVSSAAFTIFVARPPLSKAEDQPLTGLIATSDKTRDPNESLLTGLKSKKETPKAFAFWELSLICTKFDIRRKSIYTEVDRTGGNTWSQISTLCLDEISAVQTRIKAAQQPAQGSAQAAQTQNSARPQQQDFSMPKIADRTVQSGDVWVKSRPDLAHSIGNIARSVGQNQGSHSPLVPTARRAIEWSADHVLSKDEQAKFSPAAFSKQASNYMSQTLRTPPGEPFRQKFARSVCVVIYGAPYSNKANIIHASRAISALCAHSLKEDDYAQVSKSVALIMRTYIDTIRAVQVFVQNATPNWTDVYFTDQDRDIPEVEELVKVLKQGLEEIVLVFGEYQSSIGITKKELREAKELVGKAQEMTTR